MNENTQAIAVCNPNNPTGYILTEVEMDAVVAAAERGESPDPAPGIRAKQRSVHNTYFTLPVVFTMTSNHFAMTYSHEYNWLILIAISLAGALIRVYFVARHKGRASPLPIVVATGLLLAVAAALAPRSGAMTASGTISNTTFLVGISTRYAVSCMLVARPATLRNRRTPDSRRHRPG